ncbi:hypothetical protein PIROE2DRAFT_10717 [Piromyces sp. E2]|nr:hypothetical protein PIROE2DRAFT_10717 [Piromyces sp. E2]|eukprot:OUM62857.1 hypothetical protein PIROE2DRAFT_10717 [Piromyces sp. E2]
MKSSIKITTLLSTLLMNFAYAKSNKPYYNKKEILSETHWNDMNVFNNAPSHLSVISQGRFDEGLYGKYDKNYYYPASGGEGIDVYMFDNGFNFTYEEFSDVNAKIEVMIENGKVTKPMSNKVYLNSNDPNHGSLTSIALAGKTLGVAKKVNIHGVCLVYKEYSKDNFEFVLDGIIAWLEYFKKNNLINPHKTVFNFSLCGAAHVDEFNYNEKYRKAQNLINEISEMGVVFVAAAGNFGIQSYDEKIDMVIFPCAFDNVICVGGATNFNITGLVNDEIDSSYYTVGKFNKDINSNYGSHVDIYAPFTYHYHGELMNDQSSQAFGIDESKFEVEDTEYGKLFKNVDILLPGTSISSPIVAGVAATLMSEYPEKKFTSKSMLEYLTEIGEKDIIQGVPEGCSNVFINNGKKIVYDADTETELDDSFLSENDQNLSSDSEVEVDSDSVMTTADNQSDVESENVMIVDNKSDLKLKKVMTKKRRCYVHNI